MSSDAEVTLPITGGARLRVRVPEGAAPEAASDLPAVDVSNLPGLALPSLPGAHIALRRGYRARQAGGHPQTPGDLTLRAACMAAPADGATSEEAQRMREALLAIREDLVSLIQELGG